MSTPILHDNLPLIEVADKRILDDLYPNPAYRTAPADPSLGTCRCDRSGAIRQSTESLAEARPHPEGDGITRWINSISISMTTST